MRCSEYFLKYNFSRYRKSWLDCLRTFELSWLYQNGLYLRYLENFGNLWLVLYILYVLDMIIFKRVLHLFVVFGSKFLFYTTRTHSRSSLRNFNFTFSAFFHDRSSKFSALCSLPSSILAIPITFTANHMSCMLKIGCLITNKILFKLNVRDLNPIRKEVVDSGCQTTTSFIPSLYSDKEFNRIPSTFPPYRHSMGLSPIRVIGFEPM